jgi:hypothetical protein
MHMLYLWEHLKYATNGVWQPETAELLLSTEILSSDDHLQVDQFDTYAAKKFCFLLLLDNPPQRCI